MSDRRDPQDPRDHREEWAALDEPAPSPEELQAAAQLAALLRDDLHAPQPSALSASELDVDADLAMVQLLQHVEAPPALSDARRDAVEAMFLDILDEKMTTPALEVISAPVQAPQAPQAPRQVETPEEPTQRWWAQLAGWFATGPRLAMAGAFAMLIAVVSVNSLTQYSPAPQPQRQASYAMQPPNQLRVVAQLSGSPWRPGQDPFATTRSSSQRLQRVLEHNSQSALDDAFSAQSQQHLYRLR